MKTVLDTIQIVSSPGVLDGKPRLEGRRVGVDLIAYHIRYQGWSLRELQEAYDLSPAEIHAALSYYYAHPDEIEALISENIGEEDARPAVDELASVLDALLTTGQAADRLGVSERAVRKLIESGTLPARRMGANWFIHPDDLDRPEVRGRKPGRPPADSRS